MRQRLAALTTALFMAAGTLAAEEPPAAQAGGAGTLTIGITQFPSTFHPAIDSMLAKSYMHGLTRRPITAYDPDWELTCLVCQELPTLENGMAEKIELEDGDEGIAVTYKLHPEATWGDGEPVTAEDVKFTWEVGKHPDTGVAAAEAYRRILDIEVHDDHSFTAQIDRITFDYSAFGLPILPAHLEREIFEDDPAQYRNRTLFDRDPANSGLHFGPYRMVDVTTGARATFEPNPTWYGEPPAFDRIVLRVVENTAALEANLLSGAIDMVAGELGMTVDQAVALERRYGERFDFVYRPGLIYEHIDFNLDNPILQDRKVRHALAYASNRDVISEALFDGRQPAAHSNISPLDAVHNDDIPRYPYDPEKAESLLEDAGWNDLRNGIRYDGEGNPLRLTFQTTAGDRTRELMQQALQSQWRDVGFDVRIRNEPPRVFFGQTMAQRNFPGMALYAWLSAPESVPRSTLHSDQIPSEENSWTGQNYPGYANPRMDDLLDGIETELDEERRQELWDEMQRLYAEDLPVLPLLWRAQAHILPKWLTGLQPTGNQFPSTFWVEEWDRAPSG